MSSSIYIKLSEISNKEVVTFFAADLIWIMHSAEGCILAYRLLDYSKKLILIA